MKPLKTPKKMFTLVCIFPAAEFTTNWTYIISAVIIFAGNFLATVAHVVYLCKYISTDVNGSIFVFMGASTFGCVTYITICVFILRKQITCILDRLSAIYDARKWIWLSFDHFIIHVFCT